MKTSTPKGISDSELRAKQDLKNSQDWMYQTGQQIQALSQGLTALAIQHGKDLAQGATDRKQLLIEFENLRGWILESLKQTAQRLGDAETKLFEVLDAFKKFREEVAMECITREELISSLAPHVKKIDVIDKDLVKKGDYFNLALDMVKTQFKDQIAVVKKDLTTVIPEVDPIKQQLDERFRVLKIDFDGLIKEITLLKRTSHYDQKKFEALFTLIEKLKGGSS